MESITGKQIQNLCQQFVTKLSLEYKPLTKEGQIEVLIYNSLLTLFSIQNRMNEKEYEGLSDEVYIYLIKEISYFKFNLPVEEIVAFIQKRFNLYKNEIFNIFEGDGSKVLEKSYYYFYIKPLSVTDENISNFIELVGFTNKIMFLSYKLRDSINELLYAENNKYSVATGSEQEKIGSSQNFGVITDIDGNTYKKIKIGEQIWLKENLTVSRFKDGTLIQQASTKEVWLNANKAKKPVCCNYNYDTTTGKKFGKLYNWYAINDLRGLAPNGWKIPNKLDWEELVNFVGGEVNSGAKLKDNYSWGSEENTNSYNFSALPGGFCVYDGRFFDIREIGSWWSSTDEMIDEAAWSLSFQLNSKNVNWGGSYKGFGFSVRCIMDTIKLER